MFSWYIKIKEDLISHNMTHLNLCCWQALKQIITTSTEQEQNVNKNRTSPVSFCVRRSFHNLWKLSTEVLVGPVLFVHE